MNRCGCNPTLEPYEFPIQEFKLTVFILKECQNPNNLCKLKRKIILEFLEIINKLECGIQPDLEVLLEEISIVYIYEN